MDVQNWATDVRATPVKYLMQGGGDESPKKSKNNLNIILKSINYKPDTMLTKKSSTPHEVFNWDSPEWLVMISVIGSRDLAVISTCYWVSFIQITSPDIPDPISINFTSCISFIHKWVITRDSVCFARVCVVNIKPHNLPQKCISESETSYVQ